MGKGEGSMMSALVYCSRKRWNLFVVSWFILLWAVFAHSAEPTSEKKCEHLLSGPLQVVGSGRDQDVQPEMKVAARELTDLAARLGMATPAHRLTFVPAPQLNLLAGLGRYSSPHWVDGQAILRNTRSAGNILEFVVNGCGICRSYYSDLNDPKSQLSIIMHVLGHNDVSSHSNYMKGVAWDPILASSELARRIQQLYDTYDHDDVSLFVQWLFSLEYLQDLTLSTFDHPDRFKPESDDFQRVEHVQGFQKSSVYPEVRHPKRPSPNALQAFVHNLSPNAPAWKRELLELFEKSRRFYSGNFATKIMNEGWATMAQYLLARHSPYVRDDETLRFGPLLANVTYPQLQNPYYLGLQSWWHLWDRFRRQDKIKNLSSFDQDKAFVAYAHQIISTHDDYDFLQMALDQEWVDKHQFFLYRPLSHSDKVDPSKYPPQPPNADRLNIALSRDYRRVVRHIQRMVAARHLMFPRIMIDDFNWKQQGFVKIRHEAFEGLTLEPRSAVQTLFVMSQILEKPVVLFAPAPSGRPGSASNQAFLVFPSGEVHIFSVTADQQLGALNASLSASGKQILDEFKESIRGIVNRDYADSRLKSQWQTLLTAMMEETLSPVRKMILYAPFADHAIMEYNDLVESRILAAAKALIQKGQTPVVHGGKIRLNVLPPIPHFQLDPRARQQQIAQKPPAPVDWSVYTPNTTGDPGQDDGTTLAKGPYLPSDLFWTTRGKGKGKGEGEGDPDEGDPDEGDGDPTEEGQPGEGHGGGDVGISVEFWGKLLQEELKLPNLRRTKGESEELTQRRRGSAHRPKGYQLDELTLIGAIEKAMAVRKKKGLPYRPGYDGLTRKQLIREGIPLMDRGDIVVADSTQIPMPDFEAVLVVVGDLTGSMAGERVEIAKQLIFNIQALLKAGYKKVTIRYVGFSMEAHELDEDKFFKTFMGGGTSYVSGLTEGKRILDTYSNSTHNKFMLLVGDAESSDQEESGQILRQLFPDLQFFSFAVTEGPHSFSFSEPYVTYMKGLKSEWPYIGVSKLKSTRDVIPSLKELFPQEPGTQ